jgi:hypothetical protein
MLPFCKKIVNHKKATPTYKHRNSETVANLQKNIHIFSKTTSFSITVPRHAMNALGEQEV